MSYYRGICNFCGTGCGHLLEVEGNRVRGVYPLPGHPLSRGRLCVRGWHIHELLQTEERITRPLIREGSSFRPVTYDEAIDFTAGHLKNFSGSEVAFLGSPRASNEENYLFGKFARAVMKSNNLSLTSDAGLEESARILLEGCGFPAMTGSLSALRQADFILVVGGDLTKQNPIIASEIHFARRAGAFLATVSPRKTQMARLSQKHLRPNPGTMWLLLEALARALQIEGLVKVDHLEGQVENARLYLEYLESLDLRQAWDRTGVEEKEIISLARKFFESESAYAFYPVGIQSLDRRSMSALFNLFLLSGKLDRSAGGICPVTGISNLLGSLDMGVSPDFLPGYFLADNEASWKRFEELWQVTLSRTPGKSAGACLLENQSLRALLVVDHDEEIIRHVNRIKELEFVVYFGAYQNAFAGLASVIFPRLNYVEGEGTYTNSERRVQLSQKKVEPPAGIKPLWEILSRLASALGQSWPYKSAEEIMAEISRVVPQYSGLTHEKLRARLGIKWPVDDQRPGGTEFPLAGETGRRFRFVLDRTGDRFQDLPSGAESRFPFKLVVGRSNYFWHQNSIMKRTFIPKREYHALLLLYPGGFVEVSEEDARALGLREKQPVRIVSEAAEIKLAARISPDILPGMLYIPYFIEEMIPGFLHRQVSELEKYEEFFLPVRLEKVE